MIRRILTLAFVLAFILPATAAAQEEEEGAGANDNGVLVISSFKCDWTKIGDINEQWESQGLTVYQQLVDEGMIRAAGTFYHWWGDEWNVHYWTVADDVSSFMAAFAEANRRLDEQYPDAANIFQMCTEHKDNIYSLGEDTEGGNGNEED